MSALQDLEAIGLLPLSLSFMDTCPRALSHTRCSEDQQVRLLRDSGMTYFELDLGQNVCSPKDQVGQITDIRSMQQGSHPQSSLP